MILLSLGISLTVLTTLFAVNQNQKTKQSTQAKIQEEKMFKKKDFAALWSEVNGFINKGLPKSALESVEKIYALAKEQKNQGQLVKAIIHKMLYTQEVEENAFTKIQHDILQELKQSEFPANQLLYSMLAEQYWSYYNSNRYRFLNRTQTSENFKNDDVETWSLEKIVETVSSFYQKSLENPDQLKTIELGIFDDVLYKNLKGRVFRPTLYDFLAHRAVDFFMNEEAGLTKPKYEFTLDNEDYFLEADEFTKLQLSTPDKTSFRFHALQYLQDLIKFHKDDKDHAALVDVDLKRLKFINSQAVISNKEIIYENVLLKMVEKYKDSPSVMDIYYELGDLYNSLGGKFKAGGTDDFRWFRKKAHEMLSTAIEKYPKALATNMCRNLMEQIETLNLQLTTENTTVPGKPFRGLLLYRNTGNISFKIVKVTREDLNKRNQMNNDDYIRFLLARPPVKTWDVKLPDEKDFQPHSTEIKFDSLPIGEYIILGSKDDSFDLKKTLVISNQIKVTDIAFITRLQDEKGWEIFLTDRDSGAPLKNATIQSWFQVYDNSAREYVRQKGKIFTTDTNGYANIPFGSMKDNYFFLEFIYKDDHLMADQSFNLYQPYKHPTKNIRTTFFLDRAIYRPGQTVYFKGIMMETDSENGSENRILPGYSSNVVLYDVNHQKVSELHLTTNEYGTYNGTFTLPTGVLTGNMQISDTHGSVYFSMEEYKRPKFSVEFKPLEKSPKLNEHLEVKGEAKAFAGFGIDNAEVKYRVVRNVFYPYSWYWYRYAGFRPTESPEMEILSGTTTTDASGQFIVAFDTIPDLSLSKESNPAFTFTVYADVTDMNGETRSSQKDIKVGYTNLVLSNTMAATIDLDEGKQTVNINSTNLSGEFVKAKGTVSIFKLKEPQRILRSRLWNKPDYFVMNEKDYIADFPFDVYNNEDSPATWEKGKTVFNSPFDTGEVKSFTVSDFGKWEPGKYLVEMISKDEGGNEIKDIKYITVFSSTAKVVPYKQPAWFAAPKTLVEPGDKAIFLIGSSEKDVVVMYEVEFHGKIIGTSFITLNNEQKRIEFLVQEEHRGNIGVHFTFIRHSRFNHFNSIITVPWTNKNLQLTFGTFRNKLLPGEKEQWQIKIKGPNNEKAAAEMVAALYDASLDEFRSNYWAFSIYPYHYLSRYWYSNSFFNIVNSNIAGIPFIYTPFESREYDRLEWFGFYFNTFYYRGVRKMSRSYGEVEGMAPPAPAAAAPVAMDSLKEEVSVSAKVADTGNAAGIAAPGKKKNGDNEAPPAEPSPTSKKEEPIQVRKNFNETAFFYPQLTTSPEGEVTISFTIPEALTKWKMLGFAHTKNLEYGMITNELVTQKDLMVIPNPPRFFRENDTIVFTSKITNLAENEISGTAKLQLLDAVTMNPIDSMFKNNELEKPFKSAKGQSTLVSWKIHIPDGQDLDAVTYRLTARADKFSDGEEQTIPILKNRMLVTETIPLPVRAGQEKTFSFDKLIKSGESTTLKQHKLTLEFTSNPAWYAVQALPYLIEYPYECMEQVFSRYYGNSVASFIVNANPRIKKVFDIWKSQFGKKDTPNANALLSSLEKNQELKSLLLEETPWVLDGKGETERKKRIALLFDLNLMADQLGRALKKLEEGQSASGAWPWFKGMFDNRYITQYIITGFAHLHALKVIDARTDTRIWKMIKKAIPYLDNEIRKDYEYLIREKIDLNQHNIGYQQIHYLYARSYFQDIPMNNNDVKAFEYYKGQAKEYWTDYKGNRFMQGLIALVMNRYKDTVTAKAIVASIKEHALYSEEMGMYWKSEWGYYWYQAPIETQALLIEVFDEVVNDQKAVDDMKTWLLKQKQTQDWGNTKATANACFALLLKGEDWLKESKEPVITLGTEHPIVLEPGKLGPDDELIKAEAGTGYFKVSWNPKDIRPEMGKVTVKNNNKIVAWGGLYWQYFENLDKITPAETPLKLSKKLFVEKSSDTGPMLHPIDSTTGLKVGDRVKVRIELRVDRNMEFVHMKDMRASAFEPEDAISMYKWQDGLGYYQATKDASTNFFFDYLPKGTYVFEYALRVTHVGEFSNGITSIQCMYAPEFTSHSEGVRVGVN